MDQEQKAEEVKAAPGAGSKRGRIIVIGGEKGGTGKTTVATHMAYMRAVSGRRVILIDADPQKSASYFCATRAEANRFPAIPCVQLVGQDTNRPRELQASLNFIVKNIYEMAMQYSDVIVDTGGRNSVEMQAAISIADGFYQPIEPGQYDTWTLPVTERAMINNNGRLVAKVFANKMPSLPNHVQRLVARLEEAMKDAGYELTELCKFHISNRDYFRLTPEFGATVFENLTEEDKTSDKKACWEMFRLYCEIYGETEDEWREHVRTYLASIEEAA